MINSLEVPYENFIKIERNFLLLEGESEDKITEAIFSIEREVFSKLESFGFNSIKFRVHPDCKANRMIGTPDNPILKCYTVYNSMICVKEKRKLDIRDDVAMNARDFHIFIEFYMYSL